MGRAVPGPNLDRRVLPGTAGTRGYLRRHASLTQTPRFCLWKATYATRCGSFLLTTSMMDPSPACNNAQAERHSKGRCTQPTAGEGPFVLGSVLRLGGGEGQPGPCP